MVEEPQAISVSAPSEDARPDPTLPGGFSTFFVILGVMALVRIGLGFISLPDAALLGVNLLLAVVFVATVILAEFLGANSKWNAKSATAFLIGGVVAQVIFVFLASRASGIFYGLSNAAGQIGLSTWCVGLGALLGINLRDKNLLIPVSIFGAAYDFYLVIAPAGAAPGAGLTKHIVQTAPKVFTSVAA